MSRNLTSNFLSEDYDFQSKVTDVSTMLAPLIDGNELPPDDLFKQIQFIEHVFISNGSKHVNSQFQSYSILTNDNLDAEEVIALLDAGASFVVISSPDNYEHVPAERLIVRSSSLELLNGKAFGGYLIDFGSAPIEVDSLISFKKKLPLSSNLFATSTDVPTFNVIAGLLKNGIDAVIPSSRFINSLDFSEALVAGLVSDRPDGLFPTIVTDEQGISLGLVYSSKESIKESLKTGHGVYQSRQRGLWHKGATSGDTQELVSIAFDCDTDAIQFRVRQHGNGFCHLQRYSCFGTNGGIVGLQKTLQRRKASAPTGSYSARLFSDENLLHAKIIEEAKELIDATTKEEIAWEMADLIYFGLAKCIANGVSLTDIENQLDLRSKKVTRRPGNAKVVLPSSTVSESVKEEEIVTPNDEFKMKTFNISLLEKGARENLLLRPVIDSSQMIEKVKPIVMGVKNGGDKALLELIEKFDGQKLNSPILKAPFDPKMMQIPDETRDAIDQAYDNVRAFHFAQLETDSLKMETMPGVECSRFSRPITRVGLYVPGGTAVLPSTALMLGIPAQVAGCKSIIIASPPRKDGLPAPEVLYVAHKVGAQAVLLAGGAQAIAAMAYGTETVPKVDKLFGPGNQWVTAAKMYVQNDTFAMTSIDMPAGPSEVLVIADSTANPAYVAADLLSQAEHGVDSQVVLVTISVTPDHLASIEKELREQALRLPRVDIIRKSIAHSIIVQTSTLKEAILFSNDYAPEHLILHIKNAESVVESIDNAGSIFVGEYSPESCGDYASGTNHTLPTYGYARVYSGVNTQSFVKHITSQKLTKEGLKRLGNTVMRLAEVEGLEAHRNAVAVRLADIKS